MNIFVSNLSFHVTENELQPLFEDFGQVDSVKIIKDRETQRSRGFGFVEIADEDNAREAIKTLDGVLLDGRNIRVSEAREREERSNSNRRFY